MIKKHRILTFALLCLALLSGCLEDSSLPESQADGQYMSGAAEGSYSPPHTEAPQISRQQSADESSVPAREQSEALTPTERETESIAPAGASTPSAEPQQPNAPTQSAEPTAPVEQDDHGTALIPVDNTYPATDPGDGGNSLIDARSTDGEISPEAFEQELLRLINAEREQNGGLSLAMEQDMRWAARIRATEVLSSLSHTRPDGTPYYTAFDEAGFSYAGKWHGENVSYMQFAQGSYNALSAARYMFDELKSSPGHYTNMLSENFTLIGIGVDVRRDHDGKTTIGSAQMFAG